MRLRTVSCHDRGWRRVRHGRGFRYLDADGLPLASEHVDRIRELVIPPAWTEVWICPHPRGHLQAVGTDDAGRRQYLYHPSWREQRDLEKFERVAELAVTFPGLRRRLRTQLRADPGDETVERNRVLAAAVRLIDLGCFRPGSDVSLEQHGSYGLTTLERDHVRRTGGALAFSFTGKAGVDHDVVVGDPDVVQVLERLRRRRGPDRRLLAVKTAGRWRPIAPDEINEHLRALVGRDMTVKDFRTWHGTVTVAVSLATGPPAKTATARKQRIRAAVTEASELLGNTPAVARSSYVDPRLIDLYESGTVLDPVPRGPDALDRAVVALLSEAR